MFYWFDANGDSYLQRRYTSNNRTNGVFYSPYQDLELISQENINGSTRIVYIRSIVSCYDDSDIPTLTINQGTTQIIYAYNANQLSSSFVEDSTIDIYHGNTRGGKALNILTPQTNEVPLPNDYKAFEARMDNFTIPNKHTRYECTLIELPRHNMTQHIVRIDPIVTPGNEGYVHHIILYWCPNDMVKLEYLNQNMDCDEFPNMGQGLYNCLGGGIVRFVYFYIQ